MKFKSLTSTLVIFLMSLPSVLAQRINFTNMTNSNNTMEIFTFVNAQADNYYGMLIIIGTFLVSFLGLKVYFSKQAFVAATFITFIVTTMLWLMDWVGGTWMIGSILLLAFGVGSLIYDSGS